MSPPSPALEPGFYWVRLHGDGVDRIMECQEGASGWFSPGAEEPWPVAMVTVTSPRLVAPVSYDPAGRDHKVAFGAGAGDLGVGLFVAMIPQAAWDYMVGGLCHDFDLTRVGVPFKVVIGRTATYDSGLAVLKRMFVGGRDVSHVSVKIGDPPDTRQ